MNAGVEVLCECERPRYLVTVTFVDGDVRATKKGTACLVHIIAAQVLANDLHERAGRRMVTIEVKPLEKA